MPTYQLSVTSGSASMPDFRFPCTPTGRGAVGISARTLGTRMEVGSLGPPSCIFWAAQMHWLQIPWCFWVWSSLNRGSAGSSNWFWAWSPCQCTTSSPPCGVGCSPPGSGALSKSFCEGLRRTGLSWWKTWWWLVLRDQISEEQQLNLATELIIAAEDH